MNSKIYNNFLGHVLQLIYFKKFLCPCIDLVWGNVHSLIYELEKGHSHHKSGGLIKMGLNYFNYLNIKIYNIHYYITMAG